MDKHIEVRERDKNGIQMKRNCYGAIDSLRTIACIGIVMMHIRANSTYAISGFIYDSVISSFTNFVFLFMVISAFGMCCGYYERVLDGRIDWEIFYKKRYGKILPFFTVLVLMDIVVSPGWTSVCEGFCDVTLLFGLFPNDITVIGVGWFLGLIFAFYLIFPFYCVLIRTKKRACMAFAVALVLNYVLTARFEVGRNNIVYCLCYFIAGGLLYLYRDKLENVGRKSWWAVVMAVTLSVVFYYAVGANTLTMLLVACTLLALAISDRGGVLENRFTKFFSSISMEVYLSHMVVFRLLEKMGLHTRFGNGWLQYWLTVIMVIVGTVVFSVVMKKMIDIAGRKAGKLLR